MQNLLALCLTEEWLQFQKTMCSLCTPQYKQPISFHPTCNLLTCHGKAAQCNGPSLGLTHPLLAALSRHLDPAWHGAVWSRQHNIYVAAWHTCYLPVAAYALVLTAGEKGLTVLVDRAVYNTHSYLGSWRKKAKQQERTKLWRVKLWFWKIYVVALRSSHSPAQIPVLLWMSAE